MTATTSLTSTQIRQQFIDFFVKKCGHTAVPSSPVVPHDDPTLLFANAGMNQFKPYFLGTEQPTFTRAVDTQKCIRAGGKHNDLDDVGKDTYHHTFFEMLGNWSFGDYFKKEAIAWAWELLVDTWGIDPERLHATYFEGDESEGLEPDLEAKELWLQFLPESRVHPGNKKDNFWEMGDTGPCGPCSELHYDRSPDKSGASLVNADAQDTVVEIWNLVFIQYNRQQSGELVPLPAKHVDTGMGFERIVRVLQGVDSNYDTDVFGPIFDAIQKITGARAYQPGADKEQLEDPINIAYRVIADHIRTLTFALSDGAHCTNEGRGYVLRSILRRAVRFGKQTLGVEDPFFYKLVPTVAEHFGDIFPEIKVKQADVEAELKEEEESFRKTLDRGIGLFEDVLAGVAGDAKRPVFPGDEAFKLHDTYGFPIGLTQLMAEERGLTVDLEGFEREMDAARERSRGEGGGADAKQSLLELVQKGLDAGWFAETNFVGHDTTEMPEQPNVLNVFKMQGEVYEPVCEADVGDRIALVFETTPFYAEAGGQVGDTGEIMIRHSTSPTGGEIAKCCVRDTIKIGGVHLHIGTVEEGKLEVVAGNPEVSASLHVDADRRAAITSNHTITHVMNRALRDLVNKDAMQKGSLVDDEKTRFDFSHGSALTPDEVGAVERQVNDDIAADLEVFADHAPQQEALDINGLRAVFGEKYPPMVRVVSVGAPVHDLLAEPDSDKWQNLSIEFCGGTHLAKTGDAEGFVIVSQDAVSKGVRRLTAITGSAAHQATAQAEALLHRAESLKDAAADKLADEIDTITKAVAEQQTPLVLRGKVQSALAVLSDKLKQHQKAQESQQGEAVVELARAIADSADDTVICVKVNGADAKSLRTAMDVIRSKKPDAAMMLAADAGEGKVALLASVPKDVIAKGLKAGDWVKHTAPIVGGGGGGRPDMAQAGGKDPSKIEEALESAKQFAEDKL
ncbi:MAG: alanine--tRNA ligase [Phycisphaeraceae bacterium]|nr:alanine--tRNA ligase [Phycisphaeraceae bacterium]